MLLTALSKIVLTLLMGLAFFLPTYTPPPPADLGPFQVIAWLVPINEIVTLTATMAVFAVVSLTYAAINWVINKGLHSG